MDDIFLVFVGVVGAFIFFALVYIGNRELTRRLDPYKKIRQEIAQQTGLKLAPMFGGDLFALQGSMGNRFVRVYTEPVWLWRRRIVKYEIRIANPAQIKLSIRSGPLVSAWGIPSANHSDPATKPFFDQFKVSGKSAQLAQVFAQNDIVRNGLMQLFNRTGGVKFIVLKDRVIGYETGYSMRTSDAEEVAIACLIFDILTDIARLVDSYGSSS